MQPTGGLFILGRLIHFLLSLMPEKEAKRAFRNRNPCDAYPHTCRRKRLVHAPHLPAVFLTHASPPSRIAADSDLIDQLWFGYVEIVRCAGRMDSIEGFKFRCSTPMHVISELLVHRNCRHARLGLNPCVTISTDFFGYFLSRKESNIICPSLRFHRHIFIFLSCIRRSRRLKRNY